MIAAGPNLAKAAQSLEAGDLDPRDLVENALAAIHQFESRVQAWAYVDELGARQQAEERARRIRAGGSLAALHGIPLGIKDIIDVEGLPTRAGSQLRENQIASSDARLVARLRAAGAIILGKTVTTEFAWLDPPPTCNPWDVRHTPGGSSSGSAAAVALGMCLAAVGTQTGGSIIRPASYCGVAGFKPTFGHVSLAGIVPVSSALDHAGPLARCVDDLFRMYGVMAEPAAWESSLEEFRSCPGLAAGEVLRGRSPLEWEVRWRACAKQPPKLVVMRDFFQRADADVQTVTWDALQRLSDAVQSDSVLPHGSEAVYANHRQIVAHDAAAYHGRRYAEVPAAFGPRIASLIEEGLAVSADSYVLARRHQHESRQLLLSLFPVGCFAAMPATNTPPPGLNSTGDPAVNVPWSYLGFPAVTIPCGLNAAGLPCGLQLVGPPNSDLRLLACAAWCEQQLPFKHQPAMLSQHGTHVAGGR